MTTKIEIKVPYGEPKRFEIEEQDIDLGDILYEGYIAYLHEAFNDYLDETIGIVDLMGLKYDASKTLKAVDEIAYDCCFIDWLSFEVEDVIEELDTYGYAIIGDIGITLISEEEEE